MLLFVVALILAVFIYVKLFKNNSTIQKNNNTPDMIDNDTAEKQPFNVNDYKYTPNNFMYDYEKVFFNLLQNEIINKYENIGVSLKVRVADLFWSIHENFEPWSFWNKHFDFVIFNTNSFLPICAIELNGIYHHKEYGNEDTIKSDKIKQELFNGTSAKSFNVKLFMIENSKMQEGIEDIKQELNNHCPVCGRKLKHNIENNLYECCRDYCSYNKQVEEKQG